MKNYAISKRWRLVAQMKVKVVRWARCKQFIAEENVMGMLDYSRTR